MNNYTPLISPYFSLKLCLTDRIDLLITIVTKTKPQTDSYLILFYILFSTIFYMLNLLFQLPSCRLIIMNHDKGGHYGKQSI